FETRIYEAALLEQLEADLTELAGTAVACRFARTGGVLRGRLTGHIPIIRRAHQALLRSGLIDVERVVVGYQWSRARRAGRDAANVGMAVVLESLLELDHGPRPAAQGRDRQSPGAR